MDFEPIVVGRQKMYQLIRREELRYPAFGNLTFWEYEEKLKAQIIANEPPAIHERFETDREYRYGIGVKLVVDAEETDQMVVEAAIARFRAKGEADWTNPDPVLRDRLPFQTEAEALEVHRRSTAQ